MKLIKKIIIVIIALSYYGCKDAKQKQVKINQPLVIKKKDTIIKATIDTISKTEIRDEGYGASNREIFSFYNNEDRGGNWSKKLFVRFQSNDGLKYSETMNFIINSDIKNTKYPISNLFDTEYTTAYVFKTNQTPKISIRLNPMNSYHKSEEEKKYNPKYLFNKNDTILYPFKLSLINGYVKSKATFDNNARVKQMNIYLNNIYKGQIKLLDTPDVQEFQVDFILTKEDVVFLEPISFYKGEKYDDVCISEIQKNLGVIAHSSINIKYGLDGRKTAL